jgi:hypothetical protein
MRSSPSWRSSSDVIRVNTATPPVRLPGDPGFSRLGFIGNDKTPAMINGATTLVNSGWPNGRRIGDDVVDIALTALLNGPTFTKIVPLGDNVHANDQLYNRVFPYLGTPHSGPMVDQRQDP